MGLQKYKSVFKHCFRQVCISGALLRSLHAMDASTSLSIYSQLVGTTQHTAHYDTNYIIQTTLCYTVYYTLHSNRYITVHNTYYSIHYTLQNIYTHSTVHVQYKLHTMFYITDFATHFTLKYTLHITVHTTYI